MNWDLVDWKALAGLADDDHPQYHLLNTLVWRS